MDTIPARLDDIEARLDAGDQRMRRIEEDLAQNTALTKANAEVSKEVHDLMDTAKTGFRVIGGIGNAVAVVAKWLAPIAAAATAIAALYHTLKTGHPPPKP